MVGTKGVSVGRDAMWCGASSPEGTAATAMGLVKGRLTAAKAGLVGRVFVVANFNINAIKQPESKTYQIN